MPVKTVAIVAGTGMYVPERVLTSDRLESDLGLPPGWILSRCGVRERRLAAADEATSDLAAAAAAQALATAGLPTEDLDLLIVCTSTPDYPMPPCAPMVLARLGARRAAGFDLAAACSGFIYGLSAADAYIRAGQCRNVLVVGANVMSRRVDWEDRDTAVLFGDGAGAVLLQSADDLGAELAGAGEPARRGILSTHLHTDGTAFDLFLVPGGGSREPLSPAGLAAKRDKMRMKGGPLARRAVRAMAQVLREALDASVLTAADVDWLVPHQANLRLIESLARNLSFPQERVVVNLDRYGNTSAATIPIALHEAVADGRLRPGHLVALTAFGGGLTAGAALLRW